MRLKTKYFGEIECEETDVLHFREGLFGFEDEKEFVLLPFAGETSTLLCFQSVASPELAFVAMNPFFLKADYAPILAERELRALGVEQSEDLCFYVLCVVRNPVADSTVNLRCPVAINDETHQAIQVILETKEYDMRHSLSEFAKKKGEGQAC